MKFVVYMSTLKRQKEIRMKKIINNFLSKKKTFAGLDIGTSSIKFMEIEGDSIENAKLIHYAVEPIPKNLMNRENNIEEIKALSDIIKRCWKKSGSTNKNVVIALSSNSTIYKKTMISDFDSDEAVKMQVDNEIVKYFPTGMALDDVAIDYYNLGQSAQSHTDNDTLLVAGKKDKIDELLAVVESAGLIPSILDIDIYAVQNLLRLLKGEEFLENNYIFLDCGGSSLRMIVFKNAEIVYTKDIEIGGIHLTNDIMLNLSLDNYEDAERMKVHRTGDDTYDMIEKQFLLNYGHEFIRAIDYFTTSTSIKEVDEIILSGGMANIPGLDEILNNMITENSEIKVRNAPYIARPLTNINKGERISLSKFNRDEAGLFLASALALRHFLRQY